MGLRARARYAPPLAVLFIAGVAAGAPTSIGCSKKDEGPALAPSATALASSESAPSAKAWHFVLDTKGTTHVDMPGLKEHISGDTSGTEGTLDVVPSDLAQSRGTVKADLSTFATHTFGDSQDALQTEHARTWLEVVVDGKTNDSMRWATFAIRAIDGISATDLTKVAPVKDGTDEVRSVAMTVHGDMLVHGHQVQKDGIVDVAFHYAPGALADALPTRVTIKSKQPLRIVLKEIDVQPRDTVGQLTAWTSRLVSKVAEFADVTFDLTAVPAK